jgi:hypothetical protein
VRHQIEQRALERVTTSRDLGAGRLLSEPVAAQAEGHLVGGEEQPGRLSRVARRRPRIAQRAEDRPAGLDLMRSIAVGGRAVGPPVGMWRRARGPIEPARRRASG